MTGPLILLDAKVERRKIRWRFRVGDRPIVAYSTASGVLFEVDQLGEGANPDLDLIRDRIAEELARARLAAALATRDRRPA
jgi:hypothetical protein